MRAPYQHIYVALDNSAHSNRCVEVAVDLARRTGARVTGSHVYAAKMHDRRFRQMESGLPQKFQVERELERQRKVHDALITKGLHLISDSYLDVLGRRCDEHGIEFERHNLDGRNFQALVQDISESDCDLVVMGALGTGAVPGSQLGSVADRVVRRVRKDVLVLRDLERPPFERMAAAIDGSPESFAGVLRAMQLNEGPDPPRALAAYDPFFHYVVFGGIVDVLSATAAKVFRFKEQERLHEEVIDTGLAKIYQAHLEIARKVAENDGGEVETRLLAGKAFEQLLQHAEEDSITTLVLGRIGVHSEPLMDLGSATCELLRRAPCNLLVMSDTYVPPLELLAEETMTWTREAWERMERIPTFVRSMTSTAVVRHAQERGHSMITAAVVEEALARLMPDEAAVASGCPVARMGSGTLQTGWRCLRCGQVAALAEMPARCSVCGSLEAGFEQLEAAQGDDEESGWQPVEAFDGLVLQWSAQARAVVATLPAGTERQAQARVEKAARLRKLERVSSRFVSETVGTSTPLAPSPALRWSPDASARLERVPEGFMRDLARRRVLTLAAERGHPVVELPLAEEGVARCREEMESAMSGGEARCPVPHAAQPTGGQARA